jgi:hypothetical protein
VVARTKRARAAPHGATSTTVSGATATLRGNLGLTRRVVGAPLARGLRRAGVERRPVGRPRREMKR